MKTFAELLLEKGLVPKDRLLSSLVKAASQVLPPERTAHQEKWFDDETLLRVIGLEIQKGITFEAACKELGLWNENIENKVSVHTKAVQQAIGFALARETGIDARILSLACGRFFDSTKKVIEPQVPAVSQPPINVATPSAPPPQLDVHFNIIERFMVDDFSEILDDTRHRELEAKLLSMEERAGTAGAAASLEDDMRNLYRDFHTIKGSSRFIKAELIEKIIHNAEDVLGFAQKFAIKLSPQDLTASFGLFLQTIDILWELREALVKTCSEEIYWKSDTSKAKYLKVYAALTALKADFDGRQYEVNLEDVAAAF